MYPHELLNEAKKGIPLIHPAVRGVVRIDADGNFRPDGGETLILDCDVIDNRWEIAPPEALLPDAYEKAWPPGKIVEIPIRKRRRVFVNQTDKVAIWQGPAWRVSSGYVHAKGTTAFDVVRFEADELGNDDILVAAKACGIDLTAFKASDIVWVTECEDDAKKYVRPGETPQQIELPPGSQIIAIDDDGGYLVLKKGD